MLHVDLCCGLGGWQAPFRDAENWRTVGIDIRQDLSPDVVGDVRRLPIDPSDVTLVTASPPCTEFSRYHMPWYDEPDPSLELVQACLKAIDGLQPDCWLLENVIGLHRYWKPARMHIGPYYFWGTFPRFDCDPPEKRKQDTWGTNPEERAKIPYAIADSLRQAVECQERLTAY